MLINQYIFLVPSRCDNILHEMNKPLPITPDGVLEDCLSLAFEPVAVKSSVVLSGLCLTEPEGNPEKIFATSGFLDGTGRELPKET